MPVLGVCKVGERVQKSVKRANFMEETNVCVWITTGIIEVIYL